MTRYTQADLGQIAAARQATSVSWAGSAGAGFGVGGNRGYYVVGEVLGVDQEGAGYLADP